MLITLFGVNKTDSDDRTCQVYCLAEGRNLGHSFMWYRKKSDNIVQMMWISNGLFLCSIQPKDLKQDECRIIWQQKDGDVHSYRLFWISTWSGNFFFVFTIPKYLLRKGDNSLVRV